MRSHHFVGCVLLLICAVPCFAQDIDSSGVALVGSQAVTILEENCFGCHDARDKTKSGLSLSTLSGVVEGGDSGPAINLEEPGASLLIQMISYSDEDHQMPPDEQLAQTDIEALTKWVTFGAPWPEGAGAAEGEVPPLMHGMQFDDEALWAFQPVDRPAVPVTSDAEWSSNPIDAFILARLDDAGLEHAAPAAKEELIRRVFYDITGLAPTQEQVATFVNDRSPKAYEHVVDYLLGSDHYGEKWGRHWLDLVRYADSNGYERDNNKPFMWRYRDYVIQSFNEDKPYDQFVVEQLAGDEADNPDAAALTATGFFLLGLWDDEPADRLLARYDNLDDMAGTTAEVFLGLTMGCARCHGHKLDPIPQADYYRYLSFFEGIDTQNRQDGTLRFTGSTFEKKVYDQKRRAEEARAEEIDGEIREILLAFREQLREKLPDVAAESRFALPDIADLRFKFYRDTWESLPDFDSLKAETVGELEHGYITLEPSTRGEAFGFVYEGVLRVPETGSYTFHFEVSDGARLVLGEQEIFSEDGLGEHAEEVTAELKAGTVPLRLAYFTKDGPARLELSWSSATMEERRLAFRVEEYQHTLEDVFREHGKDVVAKETFSSYRQLRDISRRLRRGDQPKEMAAVISERGGEAPASHVLLRGNPHTQGKKVEPGFPVVFRDADPVLPSPYKNGRSTGRRRVLAEWIANPSNPLTARVMVNRMWQFHFGRGLVRSSNNFGAQGRRPTHPELLDWLAADFVEGDWSMKRLHKRILMSNTYQMSSRPNANHLAQDPINDLFWRFNMRRLTAEELRDSLLQAGGNLNTAMYGPGIYPVMPPEAAASSSTGLGKWGKSTPEEAARRSVYVHTRRSLRLPILTSFDMPDGDLSCPVRFATTQPTQSLGMLNSAFVNEQAVLLAARVAEEVGSDVRMQVQRAIEIVTSRNVDSKDVERGLAYIKQMQSDVGTSDEKALERFCLLAVNMNEFMYID